MQVSAKRAGNWLKVGKGIAVIGMVSWVSACAPLLDQDFWDEATSFTDENYTALGLQQLARREVQRLPFEGLRRQGSVGLHVVDHIVDDQRLSGAGHGLNGDRELKVSAQFDVC